QTVSNGNCSLPEARTLISSIDRHKEADEISDDERRLAVHRFDSAGRIELSSDEAVRSVSCLTRGIQFFGQSQLHRGDREPVRFGHKLDASAVSSDDPARDAQAEAAAFRVT